MKESNAMSRYSKTMSDTMAEVRANEERLLEVSPPGFKGTVKAMKKHKDIDNPYALAWHMKNKGDEAHYKNKDGKPEKKEKFKEGTVPEPKPKLSKKDAKTLGKVADLMKKQREEVELDELSPSTLRSYSAKASDAKGHRKLSTDKVDKRYKGVATAQKKLSNEDVDEANLPPHLAKFFDKKGNPKPEVAKRMSDAAKKRKVVSKDVTPKGYGPNEDVEEGFGKLKDAGKNLDKMHKAAGIEVDKKTTKKTKGGVVQTTTYKKRQEEVDDIHAEALRENDMVEEVEWKVQLKGLPIFYVPAKSAGEVRSMLRRQIKKPDDILSIERATKAAKKKDFRDRVSGKDSDS